MHETIADFLREAQECVDRFNLWAASTPSPALADHLCYKCESHAEFEHLRRLLEEESGFIYQSMIAKRRIAIIQFKQPFATPLGEIRFLELSDQKPDNSQTSGFDHIELYPTEGTMADLAKNLAEKGLVFEKVERPHHTTYDAILAGSFKIRLEPEALIEKIKATEMK